jgi:hypothetical protein
VERTDPLLEAVVVSNANTTQPPSSVGESLGLEPTRFLRCQNGIADNNYMFGLNRDAASSSEMV